MSYEFVVRLSHCELTIFICSEKLIVKLSHFSRAKISLKKSIGISDKKRKSMATKPLRFGSNLRDLNPHVDKYHKRTGISMNFFLSWFLLSRAKITLKTFSNSIWSLMSPQSPCSALPKLYIEKWYQVGILVMKKLNTFMVWPLLKIWSTYEIAKTSPFVRLILLKNFFRVYYPNWKS